MNRAKNLWEAVVLKTLIFFSPRPHKKKEVSFTFKNLFGVLKIQRNWCDWSTYPHGTPSEDKLALYMMGQNQERSFLTLVTYTQRHAHIHTWINRDTHGRIMVGKHGKMSRISILLVDTQVLSCGIGSPESF